MSGVVSTPWGPVQVAASERGVVAIDQLVTVDGFEAGLVRRFSRAALRGSGTKRGAAMLQRSLAAIRRYAEGQLDALDNLPIDIADCSAFDREVFAAVRQIRPGSTASYGQVARMVGRPGAARAVGGAVGRCPVALVIPCHRVIAGDGSLGGYGGGPWGGRAQGLELKRELLAREGVLIDLKADDRRR